MGCAVELGTLPAEGAEGEEDPDRWAQEVATASRTSNAAAGRRWNRFINHPKRKELRAFSAYAHRQAQDSQFGGGGRSGLQKARRSQRIRKLGRGIPPGEERFFDFVARHPAAGCRKQSRATPLRMTANVVEAVNGVGVASRKEQRKSLGGEACWASRLVIRLKKRTRNELLGINEVL